MNGPLNAQHGPPPGAGEPGALADDALSMLRAVLDAVPARVIVVDRGEHLIYANDEFFAFTRLHPKQVLGRHIGQIVGQHTYETYARVRERLHRGEPVQWEGWTELAGQGRRFMRERLVPCGGGAGEPPAATVVMSLDMTALKEREAELSAKVSELQSTEAVKSAIVDHALAAVVSTDAEGRVIEFNPAAESMFGWRRADVLGRPVAELIIPHRHREAHHAGVARLAAGGIPRLMGRRVDMQALRADGSEFPVEMVLWRSEAAGQPFYTASMTDQTERRHAAQEIERQRDALRQSEKLSAMGSLLAGVAHELNNPLAIVMGRASLVEDRLAGTPLAGEAQRIREAADRCGRIVRTFLNMARQRPPERAPVVLNQLVAAAVEMLRYGLRTHGIELTLQLDADMPEVPADADQLGQIVLNLLVNAQQALSGHDGDRRLWVRTGVEQSDVARHVWLRVADSGPGVPEAQRERIFEPFFTTKPEGIGTGLGLSVSRSIAREHGGDLTLEESGHGAGFLLVLPLQRPADVPAGEPAGAEAAAAPGKASVLVVDDEPEIAELMRDFLLGDGFTVATAASGREALAAVRRERFDAIVSDLRMPDIDGAALWREVRASHPALARRMLFVTGDTLSPGAQRFLADAGAPSIDKPFTKAALVRALRALLDG